MLDGVSRSISLGRGGSGAGEARLGTRIATIEKRSRAGARDLFGTGGGGRTRTPLRELDFESSASANSATPAKKLSGSSRQPNDSRTPPVKCKRAIRPWTEKGTGEGARAPWRKQAARSTKLDRTAGSLAAAAFGRTALFLAGLLIVPTIADLFQSAFFVHLLLEATESCALHAELCFRRIDDELEAEYDADLEQLAAVVVERFRV